VAPMYNVNMNEIIKWIFKWG